MTTLCDGAVIEQKVSGLGICTQGKVEFFLRSKFIPAYNKFD